jgi:hypothetical protein
MDKSMLAKLIDNTPLALVVIGLFLFVIGAAGGWPNPPLQVTESGWRIALAAFGAFIGITGTLSFWRERTRERTATQVLSCDACDIKLVSPAVGEHVKHSFPVSGTYQKLPEGIAIWVVTVHGNSKNRQYWPQARATVDRQNRTWYSQVNWVGGEKSETKEILVFLVGKEGQVLIDYYDKAGNENQKWPSITKLTSDMVECTSVRVILNE